MSKKAKIFNCLIMWLFLFSLVHPAYGAWDVLTAEVSFTAQTGIWEILPKPTVPVPEVPTVLQSEPQTAQAATPAQVPQQPEVSVQPKAPVEEQPTVVPVEPQPQAPALTPEKDPSPESEEESPSQAPETDIPTSTSAPAGSLPKSQE